MNASTPRVFISYSRTSDAHSEFVVRLATDLRAHGVDVILDVWDLKEGHDKFAFMEQMVSDTTISKVLVICDRRYAQRADSRAGGVGTESTIISKEVYESVQQEKFIPIVREIDEAGEPCLPTFLKSRIFVDLSDDSQFHAGYERIVRAIFGKPLYPKPSLGTPPSYVVDETSKPIATLAARRQYVDAASKNNPNLRLFEVSLLEGIVTELQSFRSIEPSQTYDDKVVQAIADMKIFRDQFIDLVSQKAISESDTRQFAFRDVFRFLESVAQLGHHSDEDSVRTATFDHIHFIVHEMFLYLVAILIRYDRIDDLVVFLTEGYLVSRNRGKLTYFDDFSGHLTSLDETRNKRLKLSRTSVQADLLKERADHPRVSFSMILEADIVLTIRTFLTANGTTPFGHWYPRTIPHGFERQPHDIFIRGESPEGAKTLAKVTGVESIQTFVTSLGSWIESNRASGWHVNHRRIPFFDLTNLDRLRRVWLKS